MHVANTSAFALFFYMYSLMHIQLLYGLLLTGDVEINLGPRHKSGESFSIGHWNLNSVFAYIYIKLSSLKAFLAVHKYDKN